MSSKRASTPPADRDAMRRLGRWLRTRREAAGLTRNELHALCVLAGSRVSLATVASWEKRLCQPSAAAFLACARACGHTLPMCGSLTAAQVGPWLRATRAAAGLSRAALALTIGAVEADVTDWEDGFPGSRQIRIVPFLRCARACGIDLGPLQAFALDGSPDLLPAPRCRVCGRVFAPSPMFRVVCSDACRERSHRERSLAWYHQDRQERTHGT